MNFPPKSIPQTNASVYGGPPDFISDPLNHTFVVFRDLLIPLIATYLVYCSLILLTIYQLRRTGVSFISQTICLLLSISITLTFLIATYKVQTLYAPSAEYSFLIVFYPLTLIAIYHTFNVFRTIEKLLVTTGWYRPTHKSLGYCYLRMVKPEFNLLVAKWLGPFPTVLQLRMYFYDNTEKFFDTAEFAVNSRFKIYHIARGTNTIRTLLTQCEDGNYVGFNATSYFLGLMAALFSVSVAAKNCTPVIGNCYLYLFEDIWFCNAYSQLGLFPKVSEVRHYAITHPQELSTELVVVTRVMKGLYHLERNHTSGQRPFDVIIKNSLKLHQNYLIGENDAFLQNNYWLADKFIPFIANSFIAFLLYVVYLAMITYWTRVSGAANLVRILATVCWITGTLSFYWIIHEMHRLYLYPPSIFYFILIAPILLGLTYLAIALVQFVETLTIAVRLFIPTPVSPGYCYLLLITPEYRTNSAITLGPYPTGRQLKKYLVENPNTIRDTTIRLHTSQNNSLVHITEMETYPIEDIIDMLPDWVYIGGIVDHSKLTEVWNNCSPFMIKLATYMLLIAPIQWIYVTATLLLTFYVRRSGNGSLTKFSVGMLFVVITITTIIVIIAMYFSVFGKITSYAILVGLAFIPGFITLSLNLVQYIEAMLIWLRCYRPTAITPGYCYLKLFVEREHVKVAAALGPYPTGLQINQYVIIHPGVLITTNTLDCQNHTLLTHIFETQRGLAATEIITHLPPTNYVGGTSYEPVWKIRGYCYTILVGHRYRYEMATLLGAYPTFGEVLSYIEDNEIPLSTTNYTYKSFGLRIHLMEKPEGTATLSQLKALYSRRHKIGGTLTLTEVKLYKPYPRLVRMKELLTITVGLTIIDLSLYTLKTKLTDIPLWTVYLGTIINVMILLLVPLLFTLTLMQVTSKLIFNLKYTHLNNLQELPNLKCDCHCPEIFQGTTHHVVMGNSTASEDKPPTPYQRRPKHLKFVPQKPNRDLDLLNSDASFVYDRFPSPTCQQLSFAHSTGHPRNTSHSGDKKPYVRDREISAPRAQQDTRPIQLPSESSSSESSDSLEEVLLEIQPAQPKTSDIWYEAKLPSDKQTLPRRRKKKNDLTLSGKEETTEPDAESKEEVEKGKPEKSLDTKRPAVKSRRTTLKPPIRKGPKSKKRHVQMHQPHPPDDIDRFDILGYEAIRGPRCTSEHFWGVGQIVTNLSPLEVRGDWEVLREDCALSPSNAKIITENLKIFPKSRNPVLTKFLKTEVIECSSNLTKSQMGNLIKYFPGRTPYSSPTYQYPDPYRQGLINGIRKTFIDDIAQGKTVLIIGDDPTFYDCDGYYYCSPRNAAGMFEYTADIQHNIEQARISNKYYAVEPKEIYATNRQYDTVIAMFPIRYSLSTLMRHCFRIGAETVYVTIPCNVTLLTDKIGVLANLSLTFCKDLSRDNLIMKTMESDGRTWTLSFATIKEYITNELIILSTFGHYMREKSLFVPDVLIGKYSRRTFFRPTPLSLIIHTPEELMYNVLIAPHHDTKGCFSLEETCDLLIFPTTQTVSFQGQAQKQKEPNKYNMIATAEHVAPGVNKFLHNQLQNAVQRNNRSVNVAETLITISAYEKELTKFEGHTEHSWHFLAKLNLLGRLTETMYKNLIKLHKYSPPSTLTLPLTYLIVPSEAAEKSEEIFPDEETVLNPPPLNSIITKGTICDFKNHSVYNYQLMLETNQMMTDYTNRRPLEYQRVNRLGANTYHRKMLEPPLLYPKLSTHLTPLGKTYDSFTQTLAECLLRYPYCANPNLTNAAAANSLLTTSPILLIRNKTYTITQQLPENSETRYATILIDAENKFNLIQTEVSLTTYKDTMLIDYIEIPYFGLENFIVYSELNLTDAGNNLCFYRAAEFPYVEELAGSDAVCTPSKIRELCLNRGVIIVHEEEIYLPRGWGPIDIRKAVAVIGTHAYKTNLSKLLLNCNLFNYKNVDDWSFAVNGTMENIPALKHYSPSHKGTRLSEHFTEMITDLKRHEDSTGSPRLKSIMEFLRYCATSHANLISSFELISTKEPETYLRGLLTAAAYDLTTKKFVSSHRITTATYGWTGTSFIPLSWSKRTGLYETIPPRYFNGIVILTEDETFIRDGIIATTHFPRITEILSYDIDSLPITLKDGVPGCGKTYEIVHTHNPKIDLVVTSTKEAQLDYLYRCKNFKNFAKSRYRTYDSILINGGPICRKLHCDEGYMVHFGQLLLTAIVVKCKTLEVSGDKNQLPFISRCFLFEPIHHIPVPNTVVPRYTTVRLPISITEKFKIVYNQITTTNDKRGEETVEKIFTLPIIEAKFDVIMTYTQAEKEELSNLNRYAKINTVHEKQGSTGKHVLLVRTKIQNVPIYDSAEHIIVACSRHTDSITYLTVDDMDKTSCFLRGELTPEEMALKPPTEKLATEKYYTATKPLHYEAEITLNEKSRIKTDLAGWLMAKMNLRTQHTLSYRERFYTFNYPMTYQEPISYSIAEVQQIINELYDIPDEEKHEALLQERVFPLPEIYQVNYCRLSSAMQKTYFRQFCTPILITPHPKNDTGTLTETVKAINKRNENPPKINLIRPRETAEKVVQVFFETFVDKEKFSDSLKIFPYENINVLSEWLELRDAGQMRKMEGLQYLEGDPNKYSSHVKRNHKPVFNNSHNIELVAGQILAVHHPYLAAYFSEPIRTFSKRLKYCLKDQFIINDGLNMDQLNGQINNCLYRYDEFKFLEIDFSKFDKSQDDLTLETNCLLLRKFGVPEHIIEEWQNCHICTKLVFQTFGIKVETLFQRKSGDVFTFMGNTITGMTALAYVYDLSECYLGLFGGDDSIIAADPTTIIPDRSQLIGQIFNLDAKLDNFPYGHYFSSRFLLFSNGTWILVPDPMKAIFKLGRNDMYCKEHIIEYHTSFADNLKHYLCLSIRHLLASAAQQKYHKYFITKEINLITIIEFLASLTLNREKFLELYEAEEEIWNRKLTPDLRREFRKREMQIEEFVEFLYEEI